MKNRLPTHVLLCQIICALCAAPVTRCANATSVAVPTTEYQQISRVELVSVYRGAYERQGFLLKEQTTNQIDKVNDMTRLVFDFPIPKSACSGNGKGFASFVIHTPRTANQRCSPCSVHVESLGVSGCDGESLSALLHVVNSAGSRAAEEVERILRKNP